MGGPRAVDDVVVQGMEWSPTTWVTVIALSVIAAVGISLLVCRARTRRCTSASGPATPLVTATAGAPEAGDTPAVPPSDAWRSAERPVTERLAEVRRLQGAGLITVAQADLRVREILAEV